MHLFVVLSCQLKQVSLDAAALLHQLIIGALLVLGFSLSPDVAYACSCADVTPRSCNLLSSGKEAVFIGTVVETKNPPKEGDESGGIARYQFRVEEWLSANVGSQVEVLSGRGGADCSFWFKRGTQYLVFANLGKDGELWASVCSNTRTVDDAGPLIAQLRAMRNGERVARVYGTLRQVQQPYEHTHRKGFDQPLGHVTIRFESAEKKVVAKTAEDGSFQIYELPPGNYTISADLPPNLELGQSILSDPIPPVQLEEGSCIERDIEALPTGKIRGQVLGSDGNPVWNVAVELFSANHYKEDARGWWEFVDRKKKYFEFDHVAPGEYILVFNRDNRVDTDAPYPRTFFRNAKDRLNAEPIYVRPGDQLLHTDLQLSGGTATRTIRIRVLFAGGSEPASSYLLVKGSKDEDVFPSPLDENLYELKVLPDGQYSVTARTNFCDPETQSQAITFVGASAAPELIITVPDTQCEAIPPDLKKRW